MTGLTQSLLKIITTGMICGGMLSLGGKGPLREILRFGCACLTVVLLLTILRQNAVSLGSLVGYEEQIREKVEQANHETRQTVLAKTEQGLAEELERQAAVFSLDCGAKVICNVDAEGMVTVEGVTLYYRSGPRDKLQQFRQSVAAQLAIPLERITVCEEDNR